ncbi:MAG: helix-hairpin-helix domain-containing protein [Clostridiales bacterium]|nr:helix-hairpin-helix domain-containing protein [Clostridiales bacterium]
MFSSKNKDKIYIVIFIITVAAGIIYKIFFKGEMSFLSKSEVTIETGESIVESASETEAGTIYVYVCGEVNKPGVYEIERGCILNDVVNMAGGLTSEAAKEDIDLVMILNSNITIKIPKEGDELVTISSESGTEAESGLININTADKEMLKTLPGIGDVMADSIIEYRQDNVFEEKEDLMNVKGIGQSKYDMVKDLICVN